MKNPFSVDAEILEHLYRSYTEAMNMNMVLYSDNKEHESIPALINEFQFKTFVRLPSGQALHMKRGAFMSFPSLCFRRTIPVFHSHSRLRFLSTRTIWRSSLPPLIRFQILSGSGLGKMPVFTSGALHRSTIRGCTASV